MIPEQAVKAVEKFLADEFKWESPLLPEIARDIITAAAPFIRAQALTDAADDINAGSCDSNYSPEACETCRAVETLRDLAVTERGGE